VRSPRSNRPIGRLETDGRSSASELPNDSGLPQPMSENDIRNLWPVLLAVVVTAVWIGYLIA
jgi:hypothetical protein